MKLKILIFSALCALTSLNCNQKPENKESAIKTVARYAKYGAKEVAKAYVFTWLSTLGHEAGHALTHFALTGKPSKITLGEYPHEDSVQIPASGISLQLKGFNPHRGSTNFALYTSTKLNNILILTAGPLAGMATIYAGLKINNMMQAYDKDKSIKQIITDGLRMPISNASTLLLATAAYISFEQYFNLTMPLLTTNDSYRILTILFGEDYVKQNDIDITSKALAVPVAFGTYYLYKYADKYITDKIDAYFKRKKEHAQLTTIESKWAAQEQQILAKGLAL